MPSLLRLPCEPFPAILVGLLDGRLQPHLDKLQDAFVDNPPRDRPHEFDMRDGIEVLGEIGVHYVRVAAAEQSVHCCNSIARAPLRPIAIGIRFQIGLEDRLDHQLHCGLHHPVPNRRDAERSLAAVGFGDHHAPYSFGPIRPLTQLFPDPGQPLIQPRGFDLCESHPVHSRRAKVGFRQPIGVPQNIGSPDLVVEQVEAEVRFRLRLEIELLLKVPDVIRRFEAHRQRAVPTTPADSNGCTCPVSFPVRCSLPRYTGGSASASLLSRPAQASLTLRPVNSLSRPRRPLSQGFSPPITRISCLSATRPNRLLSRWSLPPPATRPCGAHCEKSPGTALQFGTASGAILRTLRSSAFHLDVKLSRRFCKIPKQRRTTPAFRIELLGVVPVASAFRTPPIQPVLVTRKS